MGSKAKSTEFRGQRGGGLHSHAQLCILKLLKSHKNDKGLSGDGRGWDSDGWGYLGAKVGKITVIKLILITKGSQNLPGYHIRADKSY